MNDFLQTGPLETGVYVTRVSTWVCVWGIKHYSMEAEEANEE